MANQHKEIEPLMIGKFESSFIALNLGLFFSNQQLLSKRLIEKIYAGPI
jgi:hypothetical protein